MCICVSADPQTASSGSCDSEILWELLSTVQRLGGLQGVYLRTLWQVCALMTCDAVRAGTPSHELLGFHLDHRGGPPFWGAPYILGVITVETFPEIKYCIETK